MSKCEMKNYENTKISNELLDYVTDGDLHAKMEGVEHSTNLREIVTIAYMIEHGKSVN